MKLKTIKEFLKVKNEYRTKKGCMSCKQIDNKIAQQFGIGIKTIYTWIRQHGFASIKMGKINLLRFSGFGFGFLNLYFNLLA